MKNQLSVISLAIKKVLESNLYKFWFVVLFVISTLAYILLPVWLVPGNTIGFQLSSFTLGDYLLFIVLSSMLSIMILMQVFVFLRLRKGHVGLFSQGGFSSLSTLFGGLLATATCSSCIAAILGFLGAGSTLFILENKPYVVSVSILFGFIGLYFSSRKVIGVCENCKVSEKNLKGYLTLRKLLTIIVVMILAIILIYVIKKNIENIKNINIQSTEMEIIGTNIGNVSPSFDVQTIDGETINSNTLRGKVVVITSSAAWCPTCSMEAQQFSPVYYKYEDKPVVFITVDIDPRDREDSINRFKIDNNTPWYYADANGGIEIIQNYAFNRFEITYILDKEGIIRFKDQGITTSEQLDREIGKLL